MAANIQQGEVIALSTGNPLRLDATQATGRRFVHVSNNATTATATIRIQLVGTAAPSSGPLALGSGTQIRAGDDKWFPLNEGFAFYASADSNMTAGAALYVEQFGS